ncbi:hypothetical protein Pmani_015938 [Petrolisthes manimaculis]|uniref:Uncharacterized protein n=1 Tax=Petrolisthes manimaculis TaxID=1843537 RepID=A0AAE1PR06_9EUCA|nr:hypothetical protein Pmani_015938 [Petrolisthes manimaculis]
MGPSREGDKPLCLSCPHSPFTIQSFIPKGVTTQPLTTPPTPPPTPHYSPSPSDRPNPSLLPLRPTRSPTPDPSPRLTQPPRTQCHILPHSRWKG